jgi:hypothetical protein
LKSTLLIRRKFRIVNSQVVDSHIVDAFDNVLDAFTISNLNEDRLVFYEYSDDEEHIFTSSHMELFNSDLVYESYESKSMEGNEEDDVELIFVATTESEEVLQYQLPLSHFSRKCGSVFSINWQACY